MTDEVQNGVKITITVEVVRDGKALPGKIEHWILDPLMDRATTEGLQGQTLEVVPMALSEIMYKLRVRLPMRTCDVCHQYATTCDEDEQGEHHPACKHAPPNPKNAGPRYRSPAVYEGSTGDNNGDSV